MSKNELIKQLGLPGQLTKTAWSLPETLKFDDWLRCGAALAHIEGAVQWWLGDWWAYGEHVYGERAKAVETLELNFQTIADYGWVANKVPTSVRNEVLSWKHHRVVAPLPVAEQAKWLRLAIEQEWSSNELRTAIARVLAVARIQQSDFDASALGKFVVLYADPPWRYEHPPMGGSNRMIEKEYPTMVLEDICALPVANIAHDDSVLFLWATTPKLEESFQVINSWGFQYRTAMVWVKDKIGMGYYVRQRHELLLIAHRGNLSMPATDVRPDSVVEAPDSVVEAPRLEHSVKPAVFYDIIDRMYPGVRKIELFARGDVGRELWTRWGNDKALTVE